MNNSTDNLTMANIEMAIHMLSEHANEPNLDPLISILEALKQDVGNEALLAELTDTWRNLGIYQGAVLTYVPNFYTFISDDIFGDDR